MANMMPLDPAPTVGLIGDWSLLASQAGRYAEWLRTTVGLRNNGTLETTESFSLDNAEYRHAFAKLDVCFVNPSPVFLLDKAGDCHHPYWTTMAVLPATRRG